MQAGSHDRPKLPHKELNFYTKQTLLTQIIWKGCKTAFHKDIIITDSHWSSGKVLGRIVVVKYFRSQKSLLE